MRLVMTIWVIFIWIRRKQIFNTIWVYFSICNRSMKWNAVKLRSCVAAAVIATYVLFTYMIFRSIFMVLWIDYCHYSCWCLSYFIFLTIDTKIVTSSNLLITFIIKIKSTLQWIIKAWNPQTYHYISTNILVVYLAINPH